MLVFFLSQTRIKKLVFCSFGYLSEEFVYERKDLLNMLIINKLID